LAQPPKGPVPEITSFADVVRLMGERGEPRLRAELINGMHIVKFEPGRIELRLGPRAQKDLPARLALKLQEWTGTLWSTTLSHQPGEPTIAEQEAVQRERRMTEARADPAVQAVLAAFPGAEIRDVRDIAKAPAPQPDAPSPEDDELS
jgi:DNA polymerase-3 subunit gamma/tau